MGEPIITSLLDTDLYKFTMMQCLWHQYPQTQVEYHFKCRKPVPLSSLKDEIIYQISHLCSLILNDQELKFLQTLPFIKSDFIDFLSTFRLNQNHIHVSTDNNLTITIQGPWVNTILFEVPILAIVNETYYRQHYPQTVKEGQKRLQQKIEFLKNKYADFRFSDFGTRRRFSHAWQHELLKILKTALPQQFIGTSNVYFAMLLNLNPIGTMAHEFLQAFQVLAPNLRGSQKFALNVWYQEYQGALGIALTDVLTMDIFLQEFDQDLAQRYDGLRQDSGDPIEWGEKALKHYRSLGIDPRTKKFVFSDGLTIPTAVKIYEHFKDKVQLYFGIGTNLTNDVGYPPIDIVIKMTHMNHHPVIKISDSPGKIICEDEKYLQYVKSVFDIKE